MGKVYCLPLSTVCLHEGSRPIAVARARSPTAYTTGERRH
ncbi:hypothetical protein FTUN_6071 [Frigoriglobus tundricola]|uniref:Uncharacterized protein n=1 Tax=Frigoriglobus tundricola TaxID=2774151 RepID=A0A6M5YZ10_9BACT|nr:hypothetical protein FTUN_6071 [Frigoriglobus tundricola]